MAMDLIKVGNNGEMEIDFDSLQEITNSEFALRIKMQIEISSAWDKIEKIKTINANGYVRVYLVTENAFNHFSFEKITKIMRFESMCRYFIEKMNEMVLED